MTTTHDQAEHHMTTTTPDTPVDIVEAESRTGLPWLRLIIAFGLGLLLAALASIAAVYAYQQQYAGRVIPGVRVGQVDLSGLDAATAKARILAAYGSLRDGKVVIDLGSGEQKTFTYVEAGRHVDADALVAQAIGIGRSGAPIHMVVDQLRTLTKGEVLDPVVTFDASAVSSRIHQIVQDTAVKPVDATVVPTADGFTTTAAKAGSMIDEGAALQPAVSALGRVDAPKQLTITAKRIVLEPTVSDSIAQSARAQAALMSQDVVLAVGDDTWTIDAATVHSWVRFAGAGAAYAPQLNSKGVQAAIAPLAKQVDRGPKEASFLVGKGGVIVGSSRSLDGRKLDVPSTTTLVQSMVSARSFGTASLGGPIPLVVVVTKPKISTEDAQAIAPLMKPISSWTTYYQSGPHNGFSANISIPALAIDGTVVAPGESFDFWNAIGEVSLAKGYKLGGAIVDGRTVEGKTLGGGICSCSTTLFNAALRAGYQMGARKNHYYYISRYPLGLDATVFDSGYGTRQTMSFTNDTQYPLLIRAFAKPGIVKFTIYSVPTGRTLEISKPIVKNVLPATTVTQYTTSLPPGVRKQIEWPATGMDVWVTATVHDSTGAIIHQTTYYSHYGRVTGIILVGQTAAAPTAEPVPGATP